ncbi:MULTISPECIES: hypothetical protein [Roseobacteraceae]|uniref:hypothetical protein n=1 Tax=Roseobacteraceae TaxID=2854170 RepID=UPI00125F5E47|nr:MULTISPECIES: hypothetical protein [Roseobacteraceae]
MRHLDCALRRNSTTVSEMLAFIHDLPRILKAAAFTGKWCKCARHWQNPSNTFDEIGRDQPHDFLTIARFDTVILPTIGHGIGGQPNPVASSA